MGGHNDNGNSNGPHEDVSRQIFEKTYKLSIFRPFCVYVYGDTRTLLTAILKLSMCVSGVEVRFYLMKK